jgi:DHA2 family multidrug resistance protein
MFILRELLAAFPAVNKRLFRIPAFSLICTTAFFNNVGLFGAQFMIPIFLQQVMGFTPLQAGLVIVPAIIISGFSSVAARRLSDLIHPGLVVLEAAVLLFWVFRALATVTILTTVGVLVVYIMGYRVCMFATQAPLTNLNAPILGADRLRMGQGLLGVTRNIGAGLGVTITSVVFERQRVAHQLSAYYVYDAAAPLHTELLGQVKSTLQQGGMVGAAAEQGALQTIKRHLDTEATAAGFQESFLFISLCFVLSAYSQITQTCSSSRNCDQAEFARFTLLLSTRYPMPSTDGEW